MTRRHRGRHARPSKAAAVVTSTAGGSITAGIIVASTVTGAHAAPLREYPATVAVVQTAVPAPHLAVPDAVTVKPGDSLSAIAQEHCADPGDWTGIYVKNKAVIGGDYNLILPGQRLVLDCEDVQLPVVTEAKVQEAPPRVQEASSPPPAPSAQSSAGSTGTVSTEGMGAFQACVIRAESGGNPQIWNPSGHWGLYQFSEGTWIAHGGSPADFGRAGASEQTRIFWNAVSADGGSDWSPYDGCPF